MRGSSEAGNHPLQDIGAEEDSIPGRRGAKRQAWVWKASGLPGVSPVMPRSAVPVLALLALFFNASYADEPPPLEAAWHLSPSVLRDATLPAGIASGSDGSVYVVEVGIDRIQKFDPDGQLVARWGAPKGEAGDLEKPFGIAVGPDDSVYVTEMGRAQVRHFDGHGRELKSWGGFGTKDGRFREPRGIAVNSGGQVYVVDGQNGRVQCFSAEGRFLNAWGDSTLSSPIDIAVTPAGDVLVTDVGSHCVHRFRTDGQFLESWRPTDGFTATGFWPQSLAVASNGTVYVADPWAAEVLEFSAEGRFLRRWPDHEPGPFPFQITPVRGTGERLPPTGPPNIPLDRRELKTPLALDVDASQRLLVVDRGLAQVRIYRP